MEENIGFFRIKVIVERVDPDQDVIRIQIDLGDDSIPQEWILSRNDIFSCTWLMRIAISQKVKNLELTMENVLDDKSILKRKLKLPNWAKYTLHQKLEKISQEMKWDGVCPKPSEGFHYR